MAKRLDCILVVDLESTCWDGNPPPGQEAEIIEIGLCVLDVGSRERVQSVSLLVRPERSTVSTYCTSLTSLTQEAVEGGMALREACRRLEREYYSSERLWASYGDYDRLMLERACRMAKVGYPFGSGHINVKSLFAVARGLQREVGLDRALHVLGWPLEGRHHRGCDDAWNIARILGHLLDNARGQG